MAIEIARGAIALLMMIFVAGCASTGGTPRTAHVDNWGEANRQTMAAQVINPSPEYDQPMLTAGDQVAAALARYRTDAVKKPERTRTSSVGSSGTSK